MLENSSLAPFNPETVTDAEGDASGIGTRSGGYAAQIPGITFQTKADKSISQDLTQKNPKWYSIEYNNPCSLSKLCPSSPHGLMASKIE